MSEFACQSCLLWSSIWAYPSKYSGNCNWYDFFFPLPKLYCFLTVLISDNKRPALSDIINKLSPGCHDVSVTAFQEPYLYLHYLQVWWKQHWLFQTISSLVHSRKAKPREKRGSSVAESTASKFAIWFWALRQTKQFLCLFTMLCS